MTVTLFVCEDCEWFTEDSHALWDGNHWGHHGVGITGEDYEEASRVAAAHIVLAKRLRSGQIEAGLFRAEMENARLNADWFSKEDSEYDND